MVNGTVFELSILEKSFGYVQLLIEGENAKKLYENEIGGHRWHRNPPTETKGRIHTSIVTVSVIDFV